MKTVSSFHFLALFPAAVLLIMNVVVLLPEHMTYMQFVRLPMGPRMDFRFDRDSRSLWLCDMYDKFISPVKLDWPIHAVNTYLDCRRRRHLIDVGKIAVYITALDGEKELVVSSSCDEVWIPSADALCFQFTNIMELPPGEYSARAVLYADPPWGTGNPSSTFPTGGGYLRYPTYPGQFLIGGWIDPLTIVIEQN